MTTVFLAVTGAQGAGKSIFTKIAQDNYQLPTYRMGEVILEACQKRGVEITGRNMGKMASILRYEGGPQAVAQKSLPKIRSLIQETRPKLVIIDGIRSYSELSLFKEELGDVRLVAIIASLKMRKQRVETRKRIDHNSQGDFEERETRELGFGLGEVITKADYFILNEDISEKEFVEKVKLFLNKILAEIRENKED
ncbi:MAG: AAA family ATPase [Candidatus Heimdallarchaeota archaeon]|nr:AAA family ATPase [Candidatus Heimdallarchaeota archaeon]